MRRNADAREVGPEELEEFALKWATSQNKARMIEVAAEIAQAIIMANCWVIRGGASASLTKASSPAT